MEITNPIIPITPIEVPVKGSPQLDLKAICIFTAIGFFLDDDTYWQNKKVLKPATANSINSSGGLEASSTYFEWHYSPRDISFETALDEFTALFETITTEQTKGKQVILPLSGGLDSRTQAVALRKLNTEVFSYSYQFENGFPETQIAKEIAKACDFNFKSFTIPKGYLWDKIDDLAKLNNCQSDFCSPRQMAVKEEFASMGDLFSLGHWGDVLFDSFNLPQMSHDDQVNFLIKKLLKRGGRSFANQLWKIWGINGDFDTYLRSRISDALKTILISDTNARLRAFKSKYWAPRWTSVNLSVFKSQKPISVPYFDNRMCAFICTIPEVYLKDRQIQIAYIKKHYPQLAKLTWQDKRPYNLYNYTSPRLFKTIGYKATNKAKRVLKAALDQPYVQRNWELQFLGAANKNALEDTLVQSNLKAWIPESTIAKYLSAFYGGDPLQNAHALNMLLVLAKFHQNLKND